MTGQQRIYPGIACPHNAWHRPGSAECLAYDVEADEPDSTLTPSSSSTVPVDWRERMMSKPWLRRYAAQDVTATDVTAERITWAVEPAPAPLSLELDPAPTVDPQQGETRPPPQMIVRWRGPLSDYLLADVDLREVRNELTAELLAYIALGRPAHPVQPEARELVDDMAEARWRRQFPALSLLLDQLTRLDDDL